MPRNVIRGKKTSRAETTTRVLYTFKIRLLEIFIRQYSVIYEESITKIPKRNSWFHFEYIYAKIKGDLELKWLTID